MRGRFLVRPLGFDAQRRGVTIDGQKATYPVIYDYCTYMPVDRQPNGDFYNWSQSLRDLPKFDPAKKQSGKREGPFAWIDQNQPDVFRFVMFGTPCTLHPESQQEVLNAFWGVNLKGKVNYTATDKAQVDTCMKNRPSGSYEPQDGTHCSYDLRKKQKLAEDCTTLGW